jgi:hypothetical protein
VCEGRKREGGRRKEGGGRRKEEGGRREKVRREKGQYYLVRFSEVEVGGFY